jgi:hypothetical protein
MNRIALAVAVLVSLVLATAARAQGVTVGDLTIDHPWARASAIANSAAYMVISTKGSAPDRLVAAASPVAATVELHTHVVEGDVMRMRPVKAIDIDPGTPAVLAPGGLHVMLMGLKGPLEEGKRFPLTLTFEKAGPVTIDVPVEAAGTTQQPGAHRH